MNQTEATKSKMSSSSDSISIPVEILTDAGHASYGPHPYSSAAVMVFAIIGLVLQIPVLYTHCGLFSVPNVPVLAMSLYYLYYMLSLTVSAAYWGQGDVTQWWDGNVWCDIDSRMKLALSLGALSAQCVINYNVIAMLRMRPQHEERKVIIIRSVSQAIACTFLPILCVAVETFTTTNRYAVMQDFGCNAQLDGSVALIVTNLMWIPILGAMSFLSMLYIAARFYQQGMSKTMRHVSFVPNMTPIQFFRIILFACTVTFVLMPLSMAVTVVNFISISKTGIQDLAWQHGKPEGWNEVIFVNFAELQLEGESLSYASDFVSMITLYVNIAISWLIFVTFGTGILSVKAYKQFIVFVVTLGGWRNTEQTEEFKIWLFEASNESVLEFFERRFKRTKNQRDPESVLVNLDNEKMVFDNGESINSTGEIPGVGFNFRNWEAKYLGKSKTEEESYSVSIANSSPLSSPTGSPRPKGPVFPVRDFLGLKPLFPKKN